MKIKITIGGNDRTAIILPADCAGLAAELMARATIFERDGYHSTSGWKRAEEGVRIEYSEGGELEPTHPLVEKAQKEADQKNSMWAREYTKNLELQKQLDALQAQLAGIQSVTSCTVSEPEAVAVHDESPFVCPQDPRRKKGDKAGTRMVRHRNTASRFIGEATAWRCASAGQAWSTSVTRKSVHESLRFG